MNPAKQDIKFLKSLKIGFTYSLKATSNSMAPLIIKEDLIIVEKILPSQLKRDDIVSYYSNTQNKIVVHRIKKIDKNGQRLVWTKGDSSLYIDPKPFLNTDFLGKAIIIIKKNKKKIELTNPLCRLFTVEYYFLNGLIKKILLSLLNY